MPFPFGTALNLEKQKRPLVFIPKQPQSFVFSLWMMDTKTKSKPGFLTKDRQLISQNFKCFVSNIMLRNLRNIFKVTSLQMFVEHLQGV